MSTFWAGSASETQDGPSSNLDPGTTKIFVPGTYHCTVSIDEGAPGGPHGYASHFDLIKVGGAPGTAAATMFSCVPRAPAPDATTFVFDVIIGAVLVGGQYPVTVVQTAPLLANGVVSKGFSYPGVTPGEAYQVWGGSAASNHSLPQDTLFAWDFEDDAVAPDIPPAPGDVVDVVDDDDVFVDTLINITDKVIRIERQGWGSGSFRIRRDAVDAPTIGTGQDGRMVKVTIPRIDPNPIFRWMIENIKTVVVDEGEEGAELISVAGRGALAYLDRAVESPFVYVVPSGPTEVHGPGPVSTGQKAGQLLRRLIAEFQHVDRPQHPIPLITVDFDYVDDSAGNAWDATPATAEWAVMTGDSALLGIQELWGMSGIDILLKPDGSMLLEGFNSYGRDLTGTAFGAGVVRFVKGVNIADTLTRTRGVQLPTTHLWVEGSDFVFVDPPVDLGTPRPVVEGFLKTLGTDAPTLTAVGTAALVEALRRGESVAFNVAIVDDNALLDENAGKYLPGPPGSNGHFWIGDMVTISTGSGLPDDFDNEDARIEAITIWFDDANNLRVKVEVKATTILGRLPVSTGSRSTFGGPPSSSGAGGVIVPPAPASSDLHDHEVDPTAAHAASAVSFSPTGTIAATNVQSAIAEAALEAIQKALLTTQDDIIVRDASAPARLAKGADGQVLTVDPTTHHLVWATPTTGVTAHSALTGLTSGDDHTQYVELADDRAIAVVIDGSGTVVPTGVRALFQMPNAGHWRAAKIIAKDASSSAVFDVWVRSGAVPTVAQTITAAAKPTLTSAQIADPASTLSGWTTAFAAGDWVAINLDSVTTATLLVLVLYYDWT